MTAALPFGRTSSGVHRAELLLRAREASLVLALFVVFGLTTIKNPHFADKSSIQQLLAGASLVALLGVGQTMVIVTRNVDLSLGSVLGLSAYSVGMLFRNHPGTPILIAFALGIVIGAAIGAINGFITTVFRVPSLVVTLAMLYIVRGVDARLVSGKQIDPTAIPRSYQRIGYEAIGGVVPWLTVLVLVVVLVAGYGMRSLRSGRDLYAIGSNPGAAELAGVPSGRRVFAAFVISGALAGLAGACSSRSSPPSMPPAAPATSSTSSPPSWWAGWRSSAAAARCTAPPSARCC